MNLNLELDNIRNISILTDSCSSCHRARRPGHIHLGSALHSVLFANLWTQYVMLFNFWMFAYFTTKQCIGAECFLAAGPGRGRGLLIARYYELLWAGPAICEAEQERMRSFWRGKKLIRGLVTDQAANQRTCYRENEKLLTRPSLLLELWVLL